MAAGCEKMILRDYIKEDSAIICRWLQNDKLLDDHTLVALTIMIAESRAEEKEMMVSVIMNCIS